MDANSNGYDEFMSPELRRLEKSLEDAIASGLKEFNDEFERHRRESDQPTLSIEEDLRMAASASETTPSSGVKSLASMFEQRLSPKAPPATNKQQLPQQTIGSALSLRHASSATEKSDALSNQGVTSDTVFDSAGASVDSANVSSKSSLSIKQGLAMFGRKSRRNTLEQPNGMGLPPPPDHSTRRHPVVITNAASAPLTTPGNRPPPERNIELRLSARNQDANEQDSGKQGVQKRFATGSLFTPIKTKESLSEKWIGNHAKRSVHNDDSSAEPSSTSPMPAAHTITMDALGEQKEVKTQFVDDATIKQRRAALVQGLKLHLREKHSIVPESDRTEESSECRDKAKRLLSYSSQEQEIDNGNENDYSTTKFDSIILNDNCALLSPIHEHSNEVSDEVSAHSLRRNDSLDSAWMLPIVNDFHDGKMKIQTLCSRLRSFRSQFCHQMIGCIENICSGLKHLALFLASRLCRIQTKCRLATATLLARLTNVVTLIANLWQNVTNYIIQCFEDWSTMMRISPDGAKQLLRWMAMMDKGTAACLASFHICMITELSAAAPRYNASLTSVLCCFQVKPVESKRQSILLIGIVLLSICIDFDWLTSRYVPDPLESEREGNIFAYKLEQEESLAQSFAWYGILCNTFVKIICLNFALGSSTRGNLIRSAVWERMRVFYTSSKPSDNADKAIRAKIVAILWIELVAAVMCFACFFVIYYKGPSTILFDDGPTQILSLQATLLYKGISGILVILSLAHHIHLRDFCTQFGCNYCCGVENGYARHREHRRIISTLRRSRKCIVLTKISDFIVGILVWINLASAHKEFTRDSPKDAKVLFALLIAVQTITSVISTGLGAVVTWWLWLSTKRPLVRPSRERRNCALDDTPTSRRKSKSPDSNSSKMSNRRHERDKRPSEEDGTPCSNRYQTPKVGGNGTYDLQNNIGTSQSLFESRISAASTPSLQFPIYTPTAVSAQLHDVAYCSAREFRSQWTNLAQGTMVSCKVEKTVPSLSDCHKHFQSRRFFVIASGVVGSETKLFLVAQRRTTQTPNRTPHSPPKEGLVARCLCEIAFDTSRNEMSAEVRCRDKRQIPFYVSALGLKELI